MYPNMTIGRPHFGPGYVPYFYAAGRFTLYDWPRPHAPLEVRFVPTSSYDFTSDFVKRHAHPVGQTVEQVIRRGYLSIPKSEPETAIITDKKHTARFGLRDGQVSFSDHLLDGLRSGVAMSSSQVSGEIV